MKRIISLFFALVLTLGVVPAIDAATTDFKITDGILYGYTGTDSSVTIPSEVYQIADDAFSGNTNITSLTLSNVSVIGNKAFFDCKNLKTITSADYVTSVGAYAFENTAYLTSSSGDVILGQALIKGTGSGERTVTGVKSISPYAFSGNTDITSVKVMYGVAEIGEGAFYGCSNLSKVAVTSRVTYIGAYAFEGTKWLSSQTGEFVTLGNGILIKYGGKDTAVTIPETVKQIGEGVFYNNQTIKTVTIPESVTSVGMRAFSGAKYLTAVTFPSSLVHIGKESFSNCVSLKTLVIPKNVEIIGESAFLGCTALSNIKYLAEASIPRGLFAKCSGLKYVHLASKLSSINDYAFLNCTGLLEVSVPDTAKAISQLAFSGANNVKTYANLNSMSYSRLEIMGVDVSQIGDANCDGRVDVKDATYIQKAIAKTVTISVSGELRGDVDFSGDINIKDGTKIQKLVAGIS